MGPARLPQDAFAFYIALGEGRSYSAVADNFGVSKTAVANRAAEEGWRERVEAIDRDLRERAAAAAAQELGAALPAELSHRRAMQGAIQEVLTADRVKALLASMLKAAVQDGSAQAGRLLLERALGRPRSEPLGADALAESPGLTSADDVRKAAHAILQAVSLGAMSPEDGQRASAVVEAARKAVETEELEQRLTALERAEKGRKR